MMRSLGACWSLALWTVGCASQTDPASPEQWISISESGITVEVKQADADYRSATLQQTLYSRTIVEQYFDTLLTRPFTVRLYPDRATMEPEWRTVFRSPGMVFQCWMIANANDSILLMLSPRVWGTETCGHPGSDTAYVRRVVTHEVVHLFHRTFNPDPSFSAMYPSWWFVEGLATLVSGQYSDGMRSQAVATLSGSPPQQLEDIWAGGAGYGLSACLVEYIAQTYGHGILRALISARNESDILAIIGVSEQTLLSDWKNAVVQ